jgi:hypothetical protein
MKVNKRKFMIQRSDMGFLLLIVLAIYGLVSMCDFLECNRKENTLENRHASQAPLGDENYDSDSRAGKTAADCSTGRAQPLKISTVPSAKTLSMNWNICGFFFTERERTGICLYSACEI